MTHTGQQIPAVLSIAGSDSSGGAGIQADLKTMEALGVYGMSAITALTAQNTCGVTEIMNVEPSFIAAQIDAVFEDIFPAAIKVGMVSTQKAAEAIAERLSFYHAKNVVVDPVMVATSGAALMEAGAQDALVYSLFATAALVTPNVPEAAALAGMTLEHEEDMIKAAFAIAKMTPGAVLIKGGHFFEKEVKDLLLVDEQVHWLAAPRIDTRNTHGTGCTLSSAIASFLALGFGLIDAVQYAKEYLTDCLSAGFDMGKGNGPLDHRAQERPISIGANKAVWRGVEMLPDKYCLVVGGAPKLIPVRLLSTLVMGAKTVVAADGGIDHLAAIGVAPHMVVGDFDSATPAALAQAQAAGAKLVQVPAKKDFTDVELALQTAIDQGMQWCVLCGVSGCRPDHEWAVLGACAKYAHQISLVILEKDRMVRILSAARQNRMQLHELGLVPGGSFSVIALTDACITEEQVVYEAQGLKLAALDPQGVSNVCSGADASIEVHAGCVAVIRTEE